MTETLIALFTAAFLSATLLPGSSEVLLVVTLAKQQAPVALAVVVATLGNTLGSVVNWAIGRYLAHFRNAKWFPVKAEKFQRYQHWYQKWGVWSLLLSWMPIIGDPLTVLAGVARTRLVVFVPVVLVAKAARYMVVAGVVGMFW